MAETDLAILLRCCLSERQSADWEGFMEAAQPIVAAAVLRTLGERTRSNRELADDLIQETFLRMCAADFRVLRNFRMNDANALRVYLKTVAASVVIDHFRSCAALKSGSGIPAANLDDVAARVSVVDRQFEAFESRMMVAQVEKCLGKQDRRNRQIFWLYHLQEMKPKVIAALPDIAMTVDAIETVVYRVTRAVRECLKKTLARPDTQFREGGRV
jgi:RNA polymerase sigma-70 factor (ECF subfamily)